MTNEGILKEILRGQPDVPEEAIQAALNNGPSIAPQLLTLIRNIRLWHTDGAGQWAVLHAIRLVSAIAGIPGVEAKHAVPALVDAIFLADSTLHEEALEDLPIALARMGSAAISPLASVLEDQTLDTTIRSVAASGLEGIAVLNPAVRDQVLESLRKVVLEPADLSAIRGHVITILAHFRAPEDRSLIKQAARSVPMLLDMDADDIDEYFRQDKDPESWEMYRSSFLDYYRNP